MKSNLKRSWPESRRKIAPMQLPPLVAGSRNSDRRSQLEFAIDSDPENAIHYYNLGVHLASDIGDHAGALVQLNVANELKPDDPATLIHRAQIYKKLGRYADANEDLLKLIDINPHHPIALRRLGALRYYHLNDPIGAIESTSKSLELQKDKKSRNISSLMTLAASEQKLCNFDSAEKYYQEVSESPECGINELKFYYEFMLHVRRNYKKSTVIISRMIDKSDHKKDLCVELLKLLKHIQSNVVTSTPDEDAQILIAAAVEKLLSDERTLKDEGATLVLVLVKAGRIADASELVERLLSLYGRQATLFAASVSVRQATLLTKASSTAISEELKDIHQDLFDAMFLATKSEFEFIAANFDFYALQQVHSHAELVLGVESANASLHALLKVVDRIKTKLVKRLALIGDDDIFCFALEHIFTPSLPIGKPELVTVLTSTIRRLATAQPHHRARLLKAANHLLVQSPTGSDKVLDKLTSTLQEALIEDFLSIGENKKAISLLRRRLSKDRSNIATIRQLISIRDFGPIPDIAPLITNALHDRVKPSVVIEAAHLLCSRGFWAEGRRVLNERTHAEIPPSLLTPLAKTATCIDPNASHRPIYARFLAQAGSQTLSPLQRAGAKLALGQPEEALALLQADENTESHLGRIGLLLLLNNIGEADEVFLPTSRSILSSALNNKNFSQMDRLTEFANRLQPLIYNKTGKDLTGVDTLITEIFAAFNLSSDTADMLAMLPTYFGAARLLCLLGRHDDAAKRLGHLQGLLATRPKQAIQAAQIMDSAFRKEAVDFCRPVAKSLSGRAEQLSPSELLQCLQVANIAGDSALANQALQQAAELVSHSLSEGKAGQATLVSLVGKLSLISSTHHSLALEWLAQGVAKFPFDATLRQHTASALRAVGDTSAAIEHLRAAVALLPWNPSSRLSLAESLRNSGNVEPAAIELEIARKLSIHDAWMGLDQPRLVGLVGSLDNQLNMLQFARETSALLLRTPPTEAHPSNGIDVLSSYDCLATVAMALVPALELRRRGYDVIHLSSGLVHTPKVGRPEVDNFTGIFDRSFNRSPICVRGTRIHATITSFEWIIDWKNRRVEALGMNFYQSIFERLNRWTRRYRFDITIPSLDRALKSSIIMLDRALLVCERLREEVANKGIPIRFVSANWQYTPYSAFRIYCDNIGKQNNMEFVAIGPGYENYYSNLGAVFSNTVAMVNMTSNPDTRAPFMAIKHEFEAWFETACRNGEDFQAQAQAWIKADRAGISQLPPQAQTVLERIEAHRERNGKVVCVFGKIVYDLTVPYTGGPAHVDMADFLNHTIESAHGADTLVLVKPHPHELRYEIAGRPNEFFLDMIDCEVPENVILLDHRWFNIRDLLPVLDLGVLWNGTTSLELGASGIPVVMCDDWGLKDYPVGHNAPRNREHYAQIIKDPSIVQTPSPEYRSRCAALLKYMSTDNVMRRYPYARRGVTNVSLGLPSWVEAEIERYFADGDSDIRALTDRFEFRT